MIRTNPYCFYLEHHSSDFLSDNMFVISAHSVRKAYSFVDNVSNVCGCVYRVVYVLGGRIQEAITDITPTYLTQGVLSKLREADHMAHSVLHDSGQ